MTLVEKGAFGSFFRVRDQNEKLFFSKDGKAALFLKQLIPKHLSARRYCSNSIYTIKKQESFMVH
jgi:hypothetical protein